MKSFAIALVGLIGLVVQPGTGRGGDGVLPLRVTGEGIATGGPFPRPAKQNFEIDIRNFEELGAMNPSIRCRLATQPADQVLLEGRFVLGSHAYNLTALCRNPNGTQYEIFARRAASGRNEQLKFDGALLKDANGIEFLKGDVRVQ